MDIYTWPKPHNKIFLFLKIFSHLQYIEFLSLSILTLTSEVRYFMKASIFMERSIHFMKKFRIALAVSLILLMSAFSLYGCGTNNKNGDMADNQTTEEEGAGMADNNSVTEGTNNNGTADNGNSTDNVNENNTGNTNTNGTGTNGTANNGTDTNGTNTVGNGTTGNGTANNGTDNTGNTVGNAVGDAIDDAGNAVEDLADGTANALDNATNNTSNTVK